MVKEFNFVKGAKLSFILSFFLIVISVFFISVKRFNFGIDFTGGLVFDIGNIESFNSVLITNNYEDAIVQKYDGGIILKISQKDIKDKDSDIENIKAIIKNSYQNVIINKVDFVGPQVGETLVKNGIMALLLSLICILFYVWIRFRLDFGLGAILSLIHDIILILGFISIFNLNFDLTTIAAILTVIGYSINDTVVIFDRIRENLVIHKTENIESIVNISINKTLKRTMYTSLSTLLAILSLLFSSVDSLRTFSIIIFVGIIIGTYSSIFIASPVLIYNNKRSK